MTIAAPEKPSTAPAKILFIGLVPIAKIEIGNNIRKTFDPLKLEQLTESIRDHGVNQPILLRPGSKEGFYELISGARRIKASVAAGLKDIPAMVKDYTGERAPIAQAIENLQREDITPLDEAYGFKALVDANEFTVKQLSEQLDKSEEYVYRAIRLLQLPAAAIEAITAGEITAAHGHQLLRVNQQEAENWLGRAKSVTAAKLKSDLDEQAGTDLDQATFPKSKPYAGELACSACPRNTGNQGMLFDGAEKGKCMDSSCFEKKTTQASEDQLVEMRKQFPSAKFVIKVHGWVSPGYTEYNDHLVRKTVNVDSTEKALQQLAKKLNKTTDYALVLSSRDSALFIATPVAKKKEQPKTEAQKSADPKKRFIEQFVADAIMIAAAQVAKKLKMTRDDWYQLADGACENLDGRMIGEVLGQDDDGYDLAKATEAQLKSLVVLNERLAYNPGDAEFKKLGVDVAGVKKKAAKEAQAAWGKQEKPA